MKVAATTTMAKMLAKAVKDKGYKVRYITCDAEAYKWYVGDIYEAEDQGDWLPNTNKFRAIEIQYPSEYYACPQYLTTREISNIFRTYRCKSAEDLIDRLVEAVEI